MTSTTGASATGASTTGASTTDGASTGGGTTGSSTTGSSTTGDSRTACESTLECVIDHSCCGYCGITSVDQLEAVHQNYAGFAASQCQPTDCYCSPPVGIAHYGARCSEGSCEVYDVRESDLSACETDADCWLRRGLTCCTCDVGDWVAVSVDYDEELCGAGPVPCPPCLPTVPPDDIRAKCGADGHCAISNFGE